VNSLTHRAVLTAVFTLGTFIFGFAQSPASGDSLILSRGILLIVVFLLLGFVLLIAEKLLQIQAMRSGANDLSRYSIFPQISKWFESKPKPYVGDAPVIKLSKGYNLHLAGAPEKETLQRTASRYAVNATDFRGIAPIPKVVVTVGQEVAAGDALFFDKNLPEVIFAAPVSGEVIEVNRGDKRAITTVVILADKTIRYNQFLPFELASADRNQIVKYICEGGVWPMIIERPFGTLADLHRAPDNIFISTFDSAPLAPDANIICSGKGAELQKGIDVLNRLTGGKVHIGLNASQTESPAAEFTQLTGAEKHWFDGKHPAGNVGVQIHHIDPIKKGGRVWTLGVQELITLGALFLRGRHEADRMVAICGSSFDKNGYLSTYVGASLGELIADSTKPNSRIISGDVLSGRQDSKDGYLHYFDDQVTSIEEGNQVTLFGWAVPRILPSVSGMLPNKILGDIQYEPNTNTNGEPRAFVMTGQYEEMLPMNIFPQQLMKAILTKDIDRMEGLGIQELAEEDIALCEFACTSKQPLQSILRDGLNMLKEES